MAIKGDLAKHISHTHSFNENSFFDLMKNLRRSTCNFVLVNFDVVISGLLNTIILFGLRQQRFQIVTTSLLPSVTFISQSVSICLIGTAAMFTSSLPATAS